MFRLALDPGHCKHTPGNRIPEYLDSSAISEWELADRVARAIEERAKKYEGFETFRVDDISGEEDVLLQDRVSKANSNSADFYLSCHFNAGICGGYGGGVTAYCYEYGGKSEEYMKELYCAVVDAGGLVGNRSTPYGENNLYVLRNTIMSAVLIEFGFMDSQDDVPVIINPEYEKKCGYAIADKLAELEGLKMKENNTVFPDVPNDHWAIKDIKWVKDNGLMIGDENGNFNPNASLTRAEMAVILHRLNRMK